MKISPVRSFILILLSVGITPMYCQQNNISVQKTILLEKEGKLSEAEVGWDAITKRTPEDAAAWGQLGLVRSRQGNYVAAIPAYKQALHLKPNLPGVALDLGLAYFIQQQFKNAAAPLRIATLAAPSDLQPKLLLGMTLYGLDRYSEAIPYLEIAVTSLPKNLQLRTTLAQSCLWATKYDCVLEQYRQILMNAPDSAQADILAGEAYDGLKDSDNALAQFRAAEKISPDDSIIHFGLGYLLWKRNDYDDAALEFKLELKDDPASAKALAYLGDIAMKQNDAGAAETYLQQATASLEKVRIAYYDLGALYASSGRNELAASEFRHAIELNPSQVDAHYRLARLYRTMGKISKANSEMALVQQLHTTKDEKLFTYIPKTSDMVR